MSGIAIRSSAAGICCLLLLAALPAGPAGAASGPCAGDLDAARIVSCLQRSRSLTIGARPASPSADLTVQFGFDSAALTPAGERALEQLAAALRSDALRNARFEIAGHTDAVGGDAYNLDLSRRRAEAARDFLATRGIAADRLVARGYGWHRLTDPEHPTAAANRRVQVTRLEP